MRNDSLICRIADVSGKDYLKYRGELDKAIASLEHDVTKPVNPPEPKKTKKTADMRAFFGDIQGKINKATKRK